MGPLLVMPQKPQNNDAKKLFFHMHYLFCHSLVYWNPSSTLANCFFWIALIFTIKIFYSINYWYNSYFKIVFDTVVNRINSSVKKIMLFLKSVLTRMSCCSSKTVYLLRSTLMIIYFLCVCVFSGFSHMQWFLGNTWVYRSKVLCCGHHSRYFYKVCSSPFPLPPKTKLQQTNKQVRKWNDMSWDIWWMTPCKYEWKNIC